MYYYFDQFIERAEDLQDDEATLENGVLQKNTKLVIVRLPDHTKLPVTGVEVDEYGRLVIEVGL